VSIGYPPQKFNLLFDIMYEYTWVRGNECQYCSYGKTFNEKDSDTLTLTNTSLSLNNINQNINGEIAYDLISIKIFSSNNMPFLIVNDDYFLDGVDGVVGFGYGSNSEINFSILDKLYHSNQIKERIFSLKFNDELVTNFTIGRIPNHIENDYNNFSFCNINKTLNSWNCLISHIIIGEEINFYKAIPLNVNAVFSSTVSNIVIPSEYLNFFIQKYFESSTDYESKYCYVKPDGKKNLILCNLKYFDIRKAPPLFFILNGFAYKIPAHDLFEHVFSDAYSQYCFFKITFSETNDNRWILGYNFLKQYEVVFNKDASQIGFYSGIKYDLTKFTSDPTEIICIYNYFIYLLFILLILCSMAYVFYKNKKISFGYTPNKPYEMEVINSDQNNWITFKK
jgi:hypothetical protein